MSFATNAPDRSGYDVVIVGGAIIGSSVAWFLSDNPDFDGSILVVERDLAYERCSTSHTNSCMRQQFSNPLNIEMSQFAAEFVRNFTDHMHNDPEVPELATHHFGYMYLASDQGFADQLRANQVIQESLGAATKIMSADEIKAAYPFYNVEDIVCGSHNLVDEGYFDAGTMFDWWRKKARQNGVEYVGNEVVSVQRDGDQVASLTLASGEVISCKAVVNATGPRASQLAQMAGIELPVEPRRRYTFMFDAQDRLDRDLPLTIDPTGVHARTDGPYYMGGATPDHDPAVDYDDYRMLDEYIFEEKIWPALAHRIPAFEKIKVVQRWAGHYAHNRFDHNVVVGPHTQVNNFYFANGFSGHGLQQSPAIGRGLAELITHGAYQTIDMTPLGYQRIVDNTPFVETAII